VIRYDPEVEDLEATERKILAIRDGIARAVESGFQPSPSALCRYCSFHDFCPVQGGVTPELPLT